MDQINLHLPQKAFGMEHPTPSMKQATPLILPQDLNMAALIMEGRFGPAKRILGAVNRSVWIPPRTAGSGFLPRI